MLRRAGHDPDSVRTQVFDSVIDGRDVARGVVKAAITFPDDRRLIFKIGNFTEEDANGPLAYFGESAFEQSIDHFRQAVVIKTLAALYVVVNVQQRVSPLEFLL